MQNKNSAIQVMQNFRVSRRSFTSLEIDTISLWYVGFQLVLSRFS